MVNQVVCKIKKGKLCGFLFSNEESLSAITHVP